MEIKERKGGFTLPGEAGYEKLTLELARKWGADVIRDSDGTKLSSEILEAGYEIYSTICIIRDHNEWARKNMDKLQQTFLMTSPRTAQKECLEIPLLEDFSKEQFAVNESAESQKYWQVFDRTSNRLVPAGNWQYETKTQSVRLHGLVPWHKYTVSFLAYRIWEEISMYNHKTNNWEKEHLMQIDPAYEETQEYMLEWMENWCKAHPHTDVVRFTSLFYNFVWIWGGSPRKQNLFTDWASYDFTVSVKALERFEKTYGYALEAEDFMNQGKFHVTHMPGGKRKRDWMEFINRFVISFGKKLIDIVHRHGKRAYVFYDDSWVGMEPYGEHFEEFGFDGIIKCVFSGFEARLCSGVKTKVHELRMHPYLFPTGVDGSPSFLEGGNPKGEAQKYWQSVRRAVLRSPIDRIGLGGYLHLVEKQPDFVDYIAEMAEEFRSLRGLHQGGLPICLKPRVGVLHYWGALRSWTLSGHFHETYMHDLIHINESLSGMPFDVCFFNFEDMKNGVLSQVDVVINAGYAGSAWSGGACWREDCIVEKLTEWVYQGGVFIGVNEPSAVSGYDTFFRMAHILGVDEDLGERVCHGRWKYETEELIGLLPSGARAKKKEGIYLTEASTKVLQEEGGVPVLTVHHAGEGAGIYLGGYEHTLENTRMLQNLILKYGRKGREPEDSNGDARPGTPPDYVTDNLYTEAAYFPGTDTLVIVNNTDRPQGTRVPIGDKLVQADLEPYGSKIIEGAAGRISG